MRANIALFVPLCASFVNAQHFAPTSREALPPNGVQTQQTSLVDLNGDGAPDLISSGTGVVWPLQVNDGRGRFVAHSLPAFGTGRHVVGDFDGDGDRDVLFGNGVLENRGPAGPAWVTVSTSEPWIACDLNGDLRDDFVSMSGAKLATSLTTFAPTNAAPPSGTFMPSSVAVGDLDGDGDLDIVWATSIFTIAIPPFGTITWPGFEGVSRNDGGGSFTNLGAAAFPGTPSDNTLDAVTLDADGDGDVDVGFLSSNGWQYVWLFWRNAGGGVFTPWTLNLDGVPLDAFDLDRDGDTDLVGTDRWFENVGAGTFLRRPLPAPGPELRAIGDVDGDLDVDLVFGGAGPARRDNRLLLNMGGATFVDATGMPWTCGLPPAPDPSQADWIVGDVDGDGFPDLLECGGPLWRNSGDGWLVPTPFPWGTAQDRKPLFVDADTDGDLDVVYLEPATHSTRVLRNDGTGAFTTPPVTVFTSNPFIVNPDEVVFAFDADGDGDQDLVGVEYSPYVHRFTILRNDGNLQFTLLTPVLCPGDPMLFACGDFDQDNDLDLIAGMSSAGPTIQLFVNDGTGAFTANPAGVVAPAGLMVFSFDVADLDGDNDLDVFVAGLSTPTPGFLVLRNNGTALVADLAATPAVTSNGWAAVGDVDGDGDRDAVVRWLQPQSGTQVMSLWSNDGTGTFTPVEDLAFGIPPFSDPEGALIDVDGDGDLDLFVANRIAANRRWHLEAPFLAQIGTTYVLRFGGSAMPNALALPWFGVPANVPWPPFGRLGIDPSTAIPLSASVLLGEIGTTSFAIPANSALVGLAFATQVLLFDGTNLHLTPSKREVVWR